MSACTECTFEKVETVSDYNDPSMMNGHRQIEECLYLCTQCGMEVTQEEFEESQEWCACGNIKLDESEVCEDCL